MTPALHKALLLTCFSIALVLFAGCDSNDMAMETPIEFGEATYQVSEASESLDVDVVLDQPADQDLTVPLSISGSAIAGVDYETLDTEAVTIEQNSTTGTLTITPIDNASIDSESRTIVLSVDADELDGYTGGQTAETEITITDNEMEGSYTLSFQEPSYTTNEFNQDTVDVVVELNQPLPTALEVSLETGGSATSANYNLLTDRVEVPANATTDTLQVEIKDTENYGNTQRLTLRLQEPDNEAISVAGTTEAEISIVNPLADVAVFAADEDFARIYAYNTFRDVAVPETGRQNSDESAGVVFDESFAFTIYPFRDQDASTDPNVFGFGSPLWSEANFTRNTNILNMVEFYSGGGPNTVDANVSSGSAGLYYPDFFRLTPDAPGATTGTVSLVVDEVRVYQRDETDDGVTNPDTFVIGLRGGGTYDEVAGTINVTITFDETAVGNGTVTRRFELSERRPSN
jgi:hypothetical protein